MKLSPLSNLLPARSMILILVLALFLPACARLLPQTSERSEDPAPVVDLDSGQLRDQSESGPVIEAAEPEAPVSTNRATIGLLAQAEKLQDNGDLEASAAVIERALRIEPRNARLWSRLAALRLAQGKSQLAANLAAKSNSLASDDTQLIEKNNEIIRDARLHN